MFIPNAPKMSYWECEWRFPKTKTLVSIALPGSEAGPDPKAREFFLALPERFEQILSACRPQLQEVFLQWLQVELPADIFSEIKLAGFGLEDPNGNPVVWDIAFETTGKKWLGITIPFLGESAQPAVVDT